MRTRPTVAPVLHPRPGRPSPVRTLARAAAALLAAGLVACRLGDGGDPSITRRELREHVAALTAERLQGRVAGTPGYDSAAAYAARALARAGLDAPAAAGGQGRYTQAIGMVRQRLGAETELELRAGGHTSRVPHGPSTFLVLAAGDGSRAMAMRPPVFVGAALHAPEHGVDDLAGLELTGRAALVTALPPRAAELARLPEPVARMYGNAEAAQRKRFVDLVQRGVAAILLVPDRWLVDDWEMVSAKQRQLHYRPADPLPGMEPDPPVPVALLHADLVDRLFLDQGYHPISHAGRYHTFVLDDVALRLIPDARPDSFTVANVVGVVRGRDRKLRDEYIVVGARLDGGGMEGERTPTGAQDAAACAALLEAAAATAAHPPRRSVLFALFTGEAGGRWGSRYFVQHPPLAGGRMVAAIDVGHVGAKLESRGGVLAYASGGLLHAVRAAAAAAPDDFLDVTDAGRHPRVLKGTAGASFEEAGVPVVRLSTAPRPEAPAPRDDVKHVDWQRLGDAARLLRSLIGELADRRSLADEG